LGSLSARETGKRPVDPDYEGRSPMYIGIGAVIVIILVIVFLL
jgi:hypothetical protein